MTTPLTSTSKILIVGAGTWGISTALHLARRGYTSITILDPHPVPSPLSAGNDVNKILESGSFTGDNADERYVSKTLIDAATEGWLHDPVFKPYFHETGCVIAASSPQGHAHMAATGGASEELGWTRLSTQQEFRATMPEGVLTGEFPGWKGWFRSKGAGWVHARKSMESAAREAARLGVRFVTGDLVGRVTGLVYASSAADVRGARTADGVEHLADRTILCAGAYAAALFDVKDQLRPTAWTLAHIKMTPAEARLYRHLPVLLNIERGFFMEPDAEKHELKLCDEHPGYCNWVDETTSVPFAERRMQIPAESEARCRAFLRETMPHLAERPFSFAAVCWCADTPNRAFLISKHPEYPSLVLGVGGSGHGFCHIPSIGGFIVDAMEGTLDERMERIFRWRPETAVNRNWKDTQDRFGPGGSNQVMNFQEVTEWSRVGTEETQNAKSNL
ncbi:FAD dependent oxidoreductase [Aspergillus varians]